MTIHKQKSKENPVDCSATYFPSSFQREKQRDGTDPTPSVPASLLASGSMCNGAGGTHTLSAQRTNRALMSFLVLPNGWGMKSCCFIHQSIGQGPGAVQASCGSPETLGLDYLGREAALASVRTHRQDSCVDLESVLLLQAAQTLSLGPSECVILALFKRSQACGKDSQQRELPSACKVPCWKAHHSFSFPT